MGRGRDTLGKQGCKRVAGVSGLRGQFWGRTFLEVSGTWMGVICEGGCPGGSWAGSTPPELAWSQLKPPHRPGNRRTRGKKDSEASSRPPPPAPHIAALCPTQVPFCHWSAQQVAAALAGPWLHPTSPRLLPANEAVGTWGHLHGESKVFTLLSPLWDEFPSWHCASV